VVAEPAHVWLVCDEQHHPVAVFTVKRRCARWLMESTERQRMTVWKVPNSGPLTDQSFWPEDIIHWWRRRYEGRDY